MILLEGEYHPSRRELDSGLVIVTFFHRAQDKVVKHHLSCPLTAYTESHFSDIVEQAGTYTKAEHHIMDENGKHRIYLYNKHDLIEITDEFDRQAKIQKRVENEQ